MEGKTCNITIKVDKGNLSFFISSNGIFFEGDAFRGEVFHGRLNIIGLESNVPVRSDLVMLQEDFGIPIITE